MVLARLFIDRTGHTSCTMWSISQQLPLHPTPFPSSYFRLEWDGSPAKIKAPQFEMDPNRRPSGREQSKLTLAKIPQMVAPEHRQINMKTLDLVPSVVGWANTHIQFHRLCRWDTDRATQEHQAGSLASLDSASVPLILASPHKQLSTGQPDFQSCVVMRAFTRPQFHRYY